MTIFSPNSVGRHDTRKSISSVSPLSANRILMRPSCGRRFSAMSSFAMILMREVMASRYFMGGRHDVVEDAVDAVPNPELLFVRLDVNVARALLNGRHQHDVHELDDWCFAALLLERFRANLFEVFQYLDIAAVCGKRHLFERFRRNLERARTPRDGRFSNGVVRGNGLDNRRFRRHDRLDVVARHELDVVHGEHVRRIGHRNRQRRAGTTERDDLVLLGCFRRN